MVFPVSDGDVATRSRPFVNVTLIVLCAAVFVYELIIGETGRLVFFYQFGLIPAELAHGVSFDSLVTPQGILTETPAMLVYVAQIHPAAGLAPLDDPFAFAQLQAFNSYLVSTLHVAHAHRMRCEFGDG